MLVALLAGLATGYYFLFYSKEGGNENHVHPEEAISGQVWTCSMHPQKQLPEPGDCPICGMDLIPAVVEVPAFNEGQFSLTENAMAMANIRTITAGGGKAVG